MSGVFNVARTRFGFAESRFLRSLLALLLITIGLCSAGLSTAAAQVAGVQCGVIDDDNPAEAAAQGLFPALFVGRAATVFFNNGTCSVGDASTNKYNLSAASNILKVLNNANSDGSQGFTPGISIAYGGSVSAVTVGGSPYSNGTRIDLDVATGYSQLVTFERPSGTPFHFSLVKPAGSTAMNAFTICDGSTPAVPMISSISTANGPQAGGTSVTITGTGFCGVTSVTFGGTAGTITASSTTSVTVTTPAHASGAVDVVVSNAASSDTLTDGFTYDSAVEIKVSGNGNEIVDGDTTPSTTDNTDYGTVGVGASQAHTFTINNSGTDALALTSTPRVTISGANAADFALTTDASTPVAAGGSTTFTITFSPSAPGARTASVTIDNNDTDEGSYTFAIQGGGVITSGTVTVVAQTAPAAAGDGTFTYSSSASALNGLSITTTGGSGSSTQLSLNAGSITLTQDPATEWQLVNIACTGDADNGSSYNVAGGTVTIDLDGGEDIVCTFSNTLDGTYVTERTSRVIANFMSRRADQIVANDPELAGRLDNQGGESNTANLSGSEGAYTMSFAADTRANALGSKAFADRFGRADGADGDEHKFGFWAKGLLAHGNTGTNDSDLGLLYLGADYRFSPDFVAGVIAQFDWTSEADDVQNTAADGFGWMIGPYMVARLHQNLIFDGRAAWGMSNNSVSPFGTYEDDFDTDRWLFRSRLTGDFKSGLWSFRPFVDLTYFKETQHAYTDSLNNLIPSQTIDLGRLTFGPKVSYDLKTENGQDVTLDFGLSGLWDFNQAPIVDLGSGLPSSVGSDFRARVETGVRMGFGESASLSLLGFYDGIGVSDYEYYGGSAKVAVPF